METVGYARAIIRSATRPDVAIPSNPDFSVQNRGHLWLELTQPNTDNFTGNLRYWDGETEEWLLVHDGFATFVSETINIVTNDQTTFSLVANCVLPENSLVWAMGAKARYGTHYTISGNTFTWLNEDFNLILDEKIEVYYNI